VIKIVLYRNYRQQDWSLEIDDKRLDHISTETVDALVECALVAAQQRLLLPQ